MDPKQQFDNACFVFRGYNVTNLGRTPELLAHRAFGPVVKQYLQNASELVAEETGRSIDLVRRVSERQETSLDSFADAVAMIMAVEVAQIQILEEFFDIHLQQAKFSAGYSLGEVTAVVCSGALELSDAMRVPVSMADDCAELGRDTKMGIVFSRGPALDFDAIKRLCVTINREGNGVVGISSYLSPNTLLILGQSNTIARFDELRKVQLPGDVHLRKNRSRWPPLHTPIMWERNIPNRAARRMHTLTGGMTAPQPPILSLVTGTASYNDYNTREILIRWIDHPQRVWDAVYETLQSTVDTVVHVGPQPNLIPATYKRIADNVQAQLSGSTPSSLGLRVVSGMARRPWLTSMLPSRTALLRAPFLRHVILEDWLLEQDIP